MPGGAAQDFHRLFIESQYLQISRAFRSDIQ
jgi:hypothetical protein